MHDMSTDDDIIALKNHFPEDSRVVIRSMRGGRWSVEVWSEVNPHRYVMEFGDTISDAIMNCIVSDVNGSANSWIHEDFKSKA